MSRPTQTILVCFLFGILGVLASPVFGKFGWEEAIPKSSYRLGSNLRIIGWPIYHGSLHGLALKEAGYLGNWHAHAWRAIAHEDDQTRFQVGTKLLKHKLIQIADLVKKVGGPKKINSTASIAQM